MPPMGPEKMFHSKGIAQDSLSVALEQAHRMQTLHFTRKCKI